MGAAARARNALAGGLRPAQENDMKKVIMVVLVGLVWLPWAATAQQWIDFYERPDGTVGGGYWATPQDGWRGAFEKPGTVNPMTGQFNTYGRRRPASVAKTKAATEPANPYRIPGSTPDKGAPNPYLIPGSSPGKNTRNPYLLPGSSPQPKTVSP